MLMEQRPVMSCLWQSSLKEEGPAVDGNCGNGKESSNQGVLQESKNGPLPTQMGGNKRLESHKNDLDLGRGEGMMESRENWKTA